MATKYFVGVDIGGTFTDVVLVEEHSHRLFTSKKLTTPSEPGRAVIEAIEEATAQAQAALADLQRVVHATTLATNLVLERKGALVGYIGTKGFGDIFMIGKNRRTGEARYDLAYQKAPALVAREMVAEVSERMNFRGEVVTALDEKQARREIEQLAEKKPQAVAICLMHGYANPAHERKVAELVRQLMPGAYVALSSEVWPEYREYERASTTVMSAYVGPLIADYVGGLETRLRRMGIGGSLQIMQSNGGVMSAAAAARKAIYLVESGPGAGVIAAAHLGQLCGRANLLSFDMGGTTAKAGLVQKGKPSITHDFQVGAGVSVGGRGVGQPLKIPVIDLAEVGAGGGSIAWVDGGGMLQVGPRSAGAAPGPACYGFGGQEPTVTDANVVLGYIDPGYFLGGKMKIYPERSREAIARVAGQLKLDTIEVARGIYEIVNTHMGSAIEVVTVQRGIDPRDYAVMAFGGAGPVHIVKVAEQFEIPNIIVPPSPGLMSALGLPFSDMVEDYVSTLLMDVAQVDVAQINLRLREMEESGRASLGKEGVSEHDIVIQRTIDMRFKHQSHELAVEIAGGEVTERTLKDADTAFRNQYFDLYGVRQSDACQLVNFRLHAIGKVAKPELSESPHSDGKPERALKAVRQAYFGEVQDFVDTAVYDRSRLQHGDRFFGPAIVEEPDSTTVCPPGYVIDLDRYLNLLITKA
jgi:N-methylhydantoinase A